VGVDDDVEAGEAGATGPGAPGTGDWAAQTTQGKQNIAAKETTLEMRIGCVFLLSQ
jgi:hypothetical protein